MRVRRAALLLFGVCNIVHAQFVTPPPQSALEAAHDPYDLLTPYISLAYTWDNNLFRLPDGANPLSYNGHDQRSDQIRSIDLGVTFDKVYEQQRFTVRVDLDQNHFSTYTYLDYTAKNGSAIWSWVFTPDITGHVLVNRTESLNSFADFTALTTFQRNINVIENRRIDADWRFSGQLHTGAALYEVTQTNTVPAYAFENVRIYSFEPNLSLVSVAGNSVELYGRVARGDYLDQQLSSFNQTDDTFTEREGGVRVTYAVDGQTSLFGQLGELARQNPHYGDRNFSGLVGVLNWNWIFSAKTSGQVQLSRSIGSYVSETSSYVITNRLAIGPTWAATEKTSFSVALRETDYDFRASLVPTELRRDHNTGILFSAAWQPVREVMLTATANKSKRNSNLPGLQYSDNLFTLGAKFSF
jgi:exopolysaccharide biosynthesis operon protein EpsL